jgi:hypothetical protein
MDVYAQYMLAPVELARKDSERGFVSYYSIAGFHPDDKNDDSLQFEINIKDAAQKEALAQIVEAKPFSEIGPGELEIMEEQLKGVEEILGRKLPVGLQYFIGSTAD